MVESEWQAEAISGWPCIECGGSTYEMTWFGTAVPLAIDGEGRYSISCETCGHTLAVEQFELRATNLGMDFGIYEDEAMRLWQRNLGLHGVA